jgi:hypothetical protein
VVLERWPWFVRQADLYSVLEVNVLNCRGPIGGQQAASRSTNAPAFPRALHAIASGVSADLSSNSADCTKGASLTSSHAVCRTFIEHEHGILTMRVMSGFDRRPPVASLTIV